METSTGYGKRASAETAMGRYKGVIGPRCALGNCCSTDRSFDQSRHREPKACLRTLEILSLPNIGATK